MAIDYSLFIVSRYREGWRPAIRPRGRRPHDRHRGPYRGRVRADGALALSSMLLFPTSFLRSMAYGGMAAVLVAARRADHPAGGAGPARPAGQHAPVASGPPPPRHRGWGAWPRPSCADRCSSRSVSRPRCSGWPRHSYRSVRRLRRAGLRPVASRVAQRLASRFENRAGADPGPGRYAPQAAAEAFMIRSPSCRA